MRRSLLAGATVLLLAAFALIGQAIIQVKYLELRLQLQRERLLNLELSSEALRLRSRQLAFGRPDYQSEIRQGALESALLNEAGGAVEVDLVHLFGVGVISVARALVWKPALKLLADRETTLLLRYAFYLERNRRYDAAIAGYRRLLESTGAARGDVPAFAHLHLGYCLAATGDVVRARTHLFLVQQNYPGTHFANAAAEILASLAEGEQRAMIASRGAETAIELARRLFQSGQCAPALRAFADATELGAMDRYRRALCLEETGRVTEAIAEHRRVSAQAADGEAARLANRRLMIIGAFYDGGPSLQKEAEQRAVNLGDAVAAAEIRSTAQSRRQATVLREVQEADDDIGSLQQDLLSQLKVEIGETTLQAIAPPAPTPAATPASEPEIAAEVSDQRNEPPADGGPATTTPSVAALQLPEIRSAVVIGAMQISLRDGRRLQATAIRGGRGQWQARTASGEESFDPAELREILPALAGGRPGLLEIRLRPGALLLGSPEGQMTVVAEGQILQLASDEFALIECP